MIIAAILLTVIGALKVWADSTAPYHIVSPADRKINLVCVVVAVSATWYLAFTT